MLQSITVDNLKCGGCANTISKKLSSMSGISDVRVDVDTGSVGFDGAAERIHEVANALEQLGYPRRGTASGLLGAVEVAKSYVSCAIGRVSQ
jgi:copper chaperone